MWGATAADIAYMMEHTLKGYHAAAAHTTVHKQ